MADLRICIQDLALYNAGRHRFEWFDIDGLDADEIGQGVADFCAKRPGCEEWAIFDYEGVPDSFGENPDFSALAEFVQIVEAAGESGANGESLALAVAYCGAVGAHYATADGFRAAFLRIVESAGDYAFEYYSESGVLDQVPDSLRYHIDWDSAGDDLLSDCILVDLGYKSLAIFDNC
jgi:antirestriction protein